ncbi:KRAB-A domain-containing protein 2-like [Penaeus monodon]|uniref:KRAB-A domain-containing protein 2-like n=1 Tax=Penaeus monodon TaxID=6687 RepID=UPI0018A78F9C|nr:KRAB-A domain-containing protein 2-like [Penaeus monodon]
MAQGSYKWIMVYQDHLTKFCVLRPLSSKRAAEVVHHLTDIFLLFGALYILQSDNGSEFTAEVISELKIICPKLVLVHGKPRHPQSQGSMERANGDIKDMLVALMGDNNTTDYGCEAKVGLTLSSLTDEVIQRMQCEDDLLAVLTTSQNGEEPGPVPSAESAEVHFDMERPSPERSALLSAEQ